MTWMELCKRAQHENFDLRSDLINERLAHRTTQRLFWLMVACSLAQTIHAMVA